ncbi:MAG: autotransporter-associated beta strand repeat-containing protein [Opitutales bacterium]|nr:autotransporter-associated beta strand repeat-containing protein [Opitutales bacterium]
MPSRTQFFGGGAAKDILRASAGCVQRILVLFLCTFFVHSASAVDFTWDGGHPGQGQGGNRLNQNFNWAGNTAPTSGTGANLIFSGDRRLNPEASSTWDINSITFNNWASAFSITGGAFTLQGSNIAYALANNSAELQTIANNLIVANPQTWRANTSKLLLTGTVSLGSNLLTLTGNSETEMTGIISGSGGLLKSGSGLLVLRGANTYTGGTTVSGGTLQGSTTSLQGSITNNASLVFDQTSSGTFAGSIGGSGSLFRRGAGVVTFSGTNSYTGDTIIESGTLRVQGGTAIGDQSRIVLSNHSSAIFDLGGSSETIGSLSGGGSSGGNVTLGSGTLTVGADNTSTTYSGIISGTGQLVHTGSGMLTLAGANTYSGGTTIQSGALQGTSTSLQGNILNQSELIFNQSNSGTYAGNISGDGNVIRQGSGVLTFSGNNVYSGDTLIESGTLRVQGGQAIGDQSRVVLANTAGAVFDLGGSNETIGSLAGGGSQGGSVQLGSGILSVGADNTDSTFAGVISGSGQLNAIGDGVLTLSGANTYTGGTTVSAGTLEGTTTSLQGDIVNNAALVFRQSDGGEYSGAVTGSGDLFKQGSGTVVMSGSIDLSGSTGVGINRGTIELGGNNVISSGTNLFIGDGASLNLAGNSVRVNELSFDNGILSFGSSGGPNHFLFNDAGSFSGVLTVQNWSEDMAGGLAFQSVASNVGANFLNSVYFSGLGSGVLGDTNQSISGYSDSWNFIVANTTPFFTWNGLGSNSNWSTDANWTGGVAPPSDTATRVAFDGTTDLTPTLNQNLTINALRFNEGAGAFNLTASGNRLLTLDGPVPSIIQMSAENQIIDFNIELGQPTVIDNIGSGSLTISGQLSGDSGFTKLGEHTLILSGDNTYTGFTTIANGTLVLQSGTALGSTAGGAAVESGAAIELEQGITVGAQALDLEGTLRNVQDSNVWGGLIAGQGNIEVAGGTLTLSGDQSNTFSGSTVVGEGTLQLGMTDGAQALSGDITVGQGTGSSTLRLLESDQIADATTVVLHANGTPVLDLNDSSERLNAVVSDNTDSSILLGSGTLTIGASEDATFAGGISGSGDLVMDGSGRWILSGSSDFSGETLVDNGTLTIRNSNALGSTAGGTTVAIGASLEIENNVSVGAESLDLAGSFINTSGDNIWGGGISGDGLIRVDDGMLTLAGSSSSTFSGQTEINAGVLQLNKSDGAQALGGVVTVGDGSSDATLRLLQSNQMANDTQLYLASGGNPVFDLNGNTEQIGRMQSSNADAVVDLGSGALTVGDSSDNTFAGVITGSGDFTLQGSGQLTLTNQNTFSGTTTVNQGTLALGVDNALSSSSNLMLTGGATVDLQGEYSVLVDQFSFGNSSLRFGAEDSGLSFLFAEGGSQSGLFQIRDWTVGGSNVIGVAASSLTNDFLNNIYFTGIGAGVGADIAGSAQNVAGYGDFYFLTPIQTFVWSGGTGPGGGGSNDNWSTGNNWEGGNAPGVQVRQAIVMAGSSKTENNMDNAYLTNSLVFRDSSFTINSSTNDTLTIGGGGILNEAEDRTQTVNVNIFLDSDQIWNARDGDMIFNGDINRQWHALTFDGEYDTTINGVISGSYTDMIRRGGGTLTLTGNNTFAGPVIVEEGILNLRNDNALGSGTWGNRVFSGAELQLQDGITVSGEQVYLSGAGTTGAGALRNIAGNNTWAGSISLEGDSTVGSDADLLTITGQISRDDHQLSFVGAGNTEVTSPIFGTGDVFIQSSGEVTYSGNQANTYSGATRVQSGILNLAQSSGVDAMQGALFIGGEGQNATVRHFSDNQIPAWQTVNVFEQGLLDLNDRNDAIATLNLRAGTVTTGTGTLSLDESGNALNTFASAISSTISGNLSLNAYEHTFTIENGAAAVDLDISASVSGSGIMRIDGGGTVRMSGSEASTQTGEVIIDAGTLILARDSNVTAINSNQVTVNSGGELVLASSEQLSSGTNLTLGGGSLKIGGNITETLGTLTLTANSTIDFGGGDGILNFDDFIFSDGTNDFDLTIVNWSGSFEGGGADQIFFGTTLSDAQLARINFNPDASRLLPGGEVVPIPEPSTYFAGAMILSFLGWRERKRIRRWIRAFRA